MYTCEDSIHLLLDYVEGKIPPATAKALEEHLSGCPPCVDFVKGYQATPALCREALAERMPERLAFKLSSFLRAHLSCKKD